MLQSNLSVLGYSGYNQPARFDSKELFEGACYFNHAVPRLR